MNSSWTTLLLFSFFRNLVHSKHEWKSRKRMSEAGQAIWIPPGIYIIIENPSGQHHLTNLSEIVPSLLTIVSLPHNTRSKDKFFSSKQWRIPDLRVISTHHTKSSFHLYQTTSVYGGLTSFNFHKSAMCISPGLKYVDNLSLNWTMISLNVYLHNIQLYDQFSPEDVSCKSILAHHYSQSSTIKVIL